MIGKKELARIHILKKEACLSEEDYRALLSGAANVDSASHIDTVDGYYAVITALEKYIMAIGKIPSGRPRHTVLTLTEAVEARAKLIMGDAFSWRMNGYLKKMNRKTLADCSPRELRRIMGFLSRIEKTQSPKTR